MNTEAAPNQDKRKKTGGKGAEVRGHIIGDAELLDLGEINLPLMDEPVHPMLKQYEHEYTKQWSAKIEEADAFVFVTAEYDYNYPAPLRNAVGKVQKIGNMLIMPACARHKPARASQGDEVTQLRVHPAAARKAVKATCPRRSPVRSE